MDASYRRRRGYGYWPVTTQEPLALLDRLPYPLSSLWVPLWFRRWGLPLWFLLLAAIDMRGFYGWYGFDSQLYYRATTVWLAGGDPWSVFMARFDNVAHFAAPPTTVILLAPFTLLPEWLFVPFWAVVSAAGAVFVVRTLRLPWWWLLFPPFLEGIVGGNPSIVLLALLLAPAPVLSALAPLLKTYAILPIIGERQWRPLVVAGILTLLSVLITWRASAQYLGEFGTISARLTVEAKGGWSAYGTPLMLPLAVLLGLLAVIDLKAAGWLIVPALWPATEFHYATLALPVANPWLGLTLAIPFVWSLKVQPIAIGIYAAWRIWRDFPSLRYRLLRRQPAVGLGHADSPSAPGHESSLITPAE
jgi:hypothetical protein